MPGVRVYVCFDLRNDADLFDRLLRESASADSPFEVVAWSTRHDSAPDWEGSLRDVLTGVDEVVVLCGEHAESSVEMSAELRLFQEQTKPYFLLYGRRNAACTKPVSARAADTFYSWIWEILKSQVGIAARVPRAKAAPVSS